MGKWRIREESGADKVVEADDLDEAIELAEEWIAGGDYGERSCYVDVWVLDLDDPDAGWTIDPARGLTHATVQVEPDGHGGDCPIGC